MTECRYERGQMTDMIACHRYQHPVTIFAYINRFPAILCGFALKASRRNIQFRAIRGGYVTLDNAVSNSSDTATMIMYELKSREKTLPYDATVLDTDGSVLLHAHTGYVLHGVFVVLPGYEPSFARCELLLDDVLNVLGSRVKCGPCHHIGVMLSFVVRNSTLES